MNLLETWATWQPKSPPFVLDEDQKILDSPRSKQAIITHLSWENARNTSDFCTPDDQRLHLGLLPQPFFGDVRRAKIYILLLNPGLGPHDYYGEYQVPAYRESVIANLQQAHTQKPVPFLFLDPQFAWHGGFDWWHGKLSKIIQQIASSRNITFAEARTYLASTIASIELLPYHSKSFKDSDRWLSRLHSVELARKFVREFVIPRAHNGEAIVIITRKIAEWGQLQGTGIISYTSAQARAAHLTPNSPGGRAILEHLGI